MDRTRGGSHLIIPFAVIGTNVRADDITACGLFRPLNRGDYGLLTCAHSIVQRHNLQESEEPQQLNEEVKVYLSCAGGTMQDAVLAS